MSHIKTIEFMEKMGLGTTLKTLAGDMIKKFKSEPIKKSNARVRRLANHIYYN